MRYISFVFDYQGVTVIGALRKRNSRRWTRRATAEVEDGKAIWTGKPQASGGAAASGRRYRVNIATGGPACIPMAYPRGNSEKIIYTPHGHHSRGLPAINAAADES